MSSFDIDRADRKLGNVWVFVQLIFCPFVSQTKTQILPNLRLPINSAHVTESKWNLKRFSSQKSSLNVSIESGPRSGRGKLYGDKRAYFGAPDGVFEADPKDTAHLHFPGFHPDAAQWLVDNRGPIQ